MNVGGTPWLAKEDESTRQKEYGVGRVLAISDGVFAFAVTLLVLDLVVPVLQSGASSADLWQALSREYVSFFSYILSFLIAGLWWNAHNQNFRHIQRSDYTLRWLNLLFLLWIALLPFFTKILNDYGSLQAAVVLYAADQAVAGVFLSLLWWYASKNRRLIDNELKKSTIRSRFLTNVITPLFFVASMGISFIDPVMAIYFWFSMFPVFFLIHRFEGKFEESISKTHAKQPS